MIPPELRRMLVRIARKRTPGPIEIAAALVGTWMHNELLTFGFRRSQRPSRGERGPLSAPRRGRQDGVLAARSRGVGAPHRRCRRRTRLTGSSAVEARHRGRAQGGADPSLSITARCGQLVRRSRRSLTRAARHRSATDSVLGVVSARTRTADIVGQHPGARRASDRCTGGASVAIERSLATAAQQPLRLVLSMLGQAQGSPMVSGATA